MAIFDVRIVKIDEILKFQLLFLSQIWPSYIYSANYDSSYYDNTDFAENHQSWLIFGRRPSLISRFASERN